jgi:hypothetical protein
MTVRYRKALTRPTRTGYVPAALRLACLNALLPDEPFASLAELRECMARYFFMLEERGIAHPGAGRR